MDKTLYLILNLLIHEIEFSELVMYKIGWKKSYFDHRTLKPKEIKIKILYKDE